jgi:hypothetical protein
VNVESLKNTRSAVGRHLARVESHVQEAGRLHGRRREAVLRKVFERIPFGQDYAGEESDAESCRDCAAARGQLHVPICCLEQCPRCGGQVLGCDCGVLERKSNRTFPVPDDQDGEVQE